VIGCETLASACSLYVAEVVRNPFHASNRVANLDEYELRRDLQQNVLQALATVRKRGSCCRPGLVLSNDKALWPREAAPSSEMFDQILDVLVSGTIVFGVMDP